MENINKESLIDKTMFMYTDLSITLILDKGIVLEDFKSIEYNKKYFTFTFKNKERKLLIPKSTILKDIIEIPDVYIMDQINFLNKIFIVKKNQIIIK